MIYILIIFAILSAIVCIRAKYTKSQKHLLIFKPLTMILIILIAMLFPAIEITYKLFIVSGLLLSLIGDIFLIFPDKYFKYGLIAFLIGHIFYILAFTMTSGFHFTFWVFLPIAILVILYLRIIIPYSGKMKIPIIIYIIVIMSMVLMAVERFHSLPTLGTFLAAIGAVLFMISDATLALNKFRKPFFSAEMIILSTYFTAQWLLALSVILT